MRDCGTGCDSGATVTGATGFSIAGKSISGCVFFICTAGFAGGSGKTVMRAVSFLGEAGVGNSAGIAAVAARADEEDSVDATGGLAGGRVGK